MGIFLEQATLLAFIVMWPLLKVKLINTRSLIDATVVPTSFEVGTTVTWTGDYTFTSWTSYRYTS